MEMEKQPRKKKEYTGNKRAMKEAEALERKQASDLLMQQHKQVSGWQLVHLDFRIQYYSF
jgi:hypothetical protein